MLQRIFASYWLYTNQKEMRNDMMVALYYGLGVLLGLSVYLMQ